MEEERKTDDVEKPDMPEDGRQIHEQIMYHLVLVELIPFMLLSDSC